MKRFSTGIKWGLSIGIVGCLGYNEIYLWKLIKTNKFGQRRLQVNDDGYSLGYRVVSTTNPTYPVCSEIKFHYYPTLNEGIDYCLDSPLKYVMPRSTYMMIGGASLTTSLLLYSFIPAITRRVPPIVGAVLILLTGYMAIILNSRLMMSNILDDKKPTHRIAN